MPGTRLTHRDREHIADGLALGRTYADIARALNRPTSTISREVARGGGSDMYHPDRAHLAATQRARRTPRTTASHTTRDVHGRAPSTTADYAEQLAENIVRTGLNRMPSRILAHLITTDSGTLTAAALTRRLRVSPASVSKAVRHLEELGLLRRHRDPHRRRDLYSVGDDVLTRAWKVSAQANASLADTTRRGADLLSPTTPAGARLRRISQFFTRLSRQMTPGPPHTTGDDALTIIAALAHAGGPLTRQQLASALGWETDRVREAVNEAEYHCRPSPVCLTRTPSGSYVLASAQGRLNADQRRSLTTG